MFVQVTNGFVGLRLSDNDEKMVIAFCDDNQILVPMIILRGFLEAHKVCLLVERSEV